jgi:hypothetical protein
MVVVNRIAISQGEVHQDHCISMKQLGNYMPYKNTFSSRSNGFYLRTYIIGGIHDFDDQVEVVGENFGDFPLLALLNIDQSPPHRLFLESLAS